MPNMAGEHTLHSLQDIRGLLLEKFNFETLPYLGTLRWMPTSDPGASEKLQIGTCDGKKVFATFDVSGSSSYQLSILREHSRQEVIEVAKKDMRTVEYLEPFSYWMARADNSEKIAQHLKTYLKACFVLRGHGGGKSVIIDKYHFPRVVQVIESKRKRGEQQANTSTSAAGRAHTLRGTIGVTEDRTHSSQSSSLPAGQNMLHARGPDRTGTNFLAISNPTYYPQPARHASSNTDAVMRDNILDLNDDTTNNPSGYLLGNAGSMQHDRTPGILPGPPLGPPTRALMKQNPARTTRSATTSVRPGKVHHDVASRGIDDLEASTRVQHLRLPPPSTPPPRTAIAADALETPRAGSDQHGDKVPPAISSPPSVTGATPFAAGISHAFDKLTDEGRVAMVTPDSELPTLTAIEEYITVHNIIGASHARIAMHRGLGAQREARIKTLQEGVEIATELANKRKQEITQNLTISNQAMSSLTSIVDLSAQFEAVSEAANRIQAAQAEIAKAATICANKTTELRRQITDLESEAQMEGERITAAEKEVETARKRKREMKEVGGTDLAFLAGREIEWAAKKRRTE